MCTATIQLVVFIEEAGKREAWFGNVRPAVSVNFEMTEEYISLA